MSKLKSMHLFHPLKGTRGFIIAWEHLLRFRYMITEQAKELVRILAFWEKHGTEATTEAFNLSRRTLFRWQRALTGAQGKLDALNPQSTAPLKRRQRILPPSLAESIISLRTIHPQIGKDKLLPLL